MNCDSVFFGNDNLKTAISNVDISKFSMYPLFSVYMYIQNSILFHNVKIRCDNLLE